MDKITAVLGLYRCLDLTVEFLNEFHSRFPDVMVAASVVGNSKEYQEKFTETYANQPWIKFVTGKEDQRVSFSETWNYAITQITTDRFVFLHNDMYVHEDFFKNLNAKMDQYGPDFFYLYTTVEPLENQGFIRPGKIVAPFGHSREELKVDEFNAFAEKYIRETNVDKTGYGFYLAGFTDSLRNVGGFDSKNFFPVFCEDDDINVRIRLKGYKVLVVPQALVYHYSSKTLRLETESSMSATEINCNRHFCRKWGFEARYLWNTDYENLPEVSIGAEKIGFTSKVTVTDIDMVNVEPLMDLVDIRHNPGVQKYFEEEAPEKVLQNPDDLLNVDILITQVGSSNFTQLAYLVGHLRFWHKKLKTGQAQVGSYIVDIGNLKEETRVDDTNYLSLLKFETENGTEK